MKPSPQNNAFFTLRLSSQTKRELHALALTAQTSVSEIVRVLLKLGLQKWKNEP